MQPARNRMDRGTLLVSVYGHQPGAGLLLGVWRVRDVMPAGDAIRAGLTKGSFEPQDPDWPGLLPCIGRDAAAVGPTFPGVCVARRCCALVFAASSIRRVIVSEKPTRSTASCRSGEIFPPAFDSDRFCDLLPRATDPLYPEAFIFHMCHAGTGQLINPRCDHPSECVFGCYKKAFGPGWPRGCLELEPRSHATEETTGEIVATAAKSPLLQQCEPR